MSTFDTYRIQEFCIPKPVLNFMMDSLNEKILKKLHKCCKYFYVKMPYAVIDVFETGSIFRKKYNAGIDFIHAQYPVDDPIFKSSRTKIWISESLFLFHLGDQMSVSKIISKIVRCDIYTLLLFCYVTIDELKLLTVSGNIEIFSIYADLDIPKDKLIPPEQIFRLIPKSRVISINQFTVTEKTMNELLKHEHHTKIRKLCFRIDREIETKLICEFLEKNLGMKARVNIRFENDDFNEVFGTEINQMISLWTPKEKIPSTFPSINTYC